VRLTSVVLLGVLVLAGCGMDSQGGYRRMQQASGSADGISFQQANTECWNMAYSLLGGNAMDSARERAYNQCMNDRGWENPSMPARPRPTTTPGSR
jgi:hypothetical protein